MICYTRISDRNYFIRAINNLFESGQAGCNENRINEGKMKLIIIYYEPLALKG